MSKIKPVSYLTVLLLTTILVATSVQIYLSPIALTPSSSEISSPSMQSELYAHVPPITPTEGRIYKVTLITGDYVLAAVTDNGTITSIAIQPVDQNKVGQGYLVLKMRNYTYVIPRDLDVSKFDLELFNIDLLIREGYWKLSSIPVIIKHQTNVGAFMQQLKDYGVDVTRDFSIVKALAVKLPKDKVAETYSFLKSSRDVIKVWLDRKVYANLNESAPLIGVLDAWELGLNGSGVRIAIIDSGIDPSHEDFFFPNGTTKIELAVSFIDYEGDGIIDEDPYDYFGHGTHVASIAAGTGAKSGGKFKGVAYGASLWNVKVLDREGWGYLSWVIAGVEYATLGPDHEPNTGDEADILSLSLGTYWWSDGTDPLSMACDAAVDFGRVVVVAAGNSPGYFRIGVPATARKAITVGASDKWDNLAYFSSWGPTIDFRIKPDILAPGVGIWAALARNSLIEYLVNQSRLLGEDADGDGRYDYVQLSGTSMSTPYVSGVAALLKQLNSSLGPLEIKNILISTANDLGYNVYQQGGGRINVTSAINPPVLVDPATISFGVLERGKLINTTISFRFCPLIVTSLTVGNLTLNLKVIMRDIITGNVLEAASLNATSITIPLFGSETVLLTLNTSIPSSFYEGKVVAEVADGPWAGRTVHAIFGFAVVNNVTIKMLNRDGTPAADRPVIVFKHDASSDLDFKFNFRRLKTDENGTAYTYTSDGVFYVIGVGLDGKVQADIFTIADRIPIYGNVEVLLDERQAREVDFDPAKPNQILAAKRLSISHLPWIQISILRYYPPTALTYITNTSLKVSFSYEYYDKSYYNLANPSVIDAPEWHNLIYWEDGLTPPVTYRADYNNLAKRVTEYRVPMTPALLAAITQHKWSPFEWFSIEFIWFMNVPRERVEWLTPNIFYRTSYEKYMDQPWTSTPYWFFAHRPELKERYAPGEVVTEVFGGHPLSTHFLVFRRHSWLEMVSDLHMDTYGHTLWYSDYGHVSIYRNGSLIVNTYVKDYFWYYQWDDPRPAHYKVVINGSSGLYLSNPMQAVLEFVVDNEAVDCSPPIIYVSVPNLDLNNTCPGGEVIVYVYIDDPRYSSEAYVEVEYSIDDGIMWRRAKPLTRPSQEGSPYLFSLGLLSDVYVSLRINATRIGANASYTIIRGFYVATMPLVLPEAYALVTGLGGDVWFRKYAGGNWSPWICLGGVTPDAPSAAFYGSKLYVAVRSADGSIWYGYVDALTDEFSGWISVPGSTQSKPSLVATAKGVLMFVRGLGDDIWVYNLSQPRSQVWIKLPGATCDAPAVVALDNKLHIVVRGIDGYSLWHGILDIDSWNFHGWYAVLGLTNSTPELSIDETNGIVYLAVVGLDGGLYVNIYSETLGWHGWINIPGGATDKGPALLTSRNMMLMVKGLGNDIWVATKERDGSWTWISIDGATGNQPELVIPKPALR